MTSARQQTSPTLAAWIAQIADGDESAFTHLFDATAASLYGMALSALGDASEAESAALDAYLELWRTARTFDSASRDASAWVNSIAIRNVVTHARCTARDGEAPRHLPIVVPEPHQGR